MGSCLSASRNGDDKINNTLNKYNTAILEQKPRSKRSCLSHISNASSSGVSSACTSPSRRSVLCRSDSTPSSYLVPNAPQVKTYNFKVTRKDAATAIKMLSICDDFDEAAKIQQHQENRSFGYYSESVLTRSTVSTSSQSCLSPIRDTRLPLESPPVTVIPTLGDLDMEMYMISRRQNLMPKTSSPIFQRRELTFDAIAVASPSSHSYKKWAKHLQSTPTHILHKVSGIPESIAGHFSPLHFPAFTDLEEMESAAKRFKVDIHLDNETAKKKLVYQEQKPKGFSITNTITTDL